MHIHLFPFLHIFLLRILFIASALIIAAPLLEVGTVVLHPASSYSHLLDAGLICLVSPRHAAYLRDECLLLILLPSETLCDGS